MAEVMEEFQETFTNPFNIKCDGCGAPAEYDIIHQNYHCQHCGATTDLHAPLRALERYRKLHAQELKANKQTGKSKKYNCPNCGAVVVIDSTEATAKCDFCGTKMVNSNFVESDAFPELIIPFKITLEEAKEELRKWIKDNSSKEEAKKLQNRVDEMKGYYLPYQVVKGPVNGKVYRADSFRKYQYGGFIEEVAVNTSQQLDNLLLDAMEPFDWREIHPFEYGFIAGQSTKLQDTNDKQIQNRINEEIKQAYLPTLEKTLQSMDLSADVDASGVLQIPALMPVYIITRGQVQCAVNGQTGRVAVTPLKEKVTQRGWLEPVLTMLVVAGLAELVPVLLGFHAHLELTAGLGVVGGLVVWAAFSGKSNVLKVIYLQSKKQLAKRINNKITYTDGKELLDNPALTPVFFEMLDGILEPVKISFYTTARTVKATIFALVLAFLPNMLAYALVAYDVYVNGDPVERFSQVHHFYAAAWWCLMIPILFVLWLAVVRRDVFDYPVIYRILPDGSTAKVEGLYEVDMSFKELIVAAFMPPCCWVTLFILFMIFGTVAAILD
ncbi:MAG: hypothetical protein MJ050_01815 [Phascolarctobacterium sp.]|nr:hypothetical protein [Phascolarctobacterium sp.]